VHVNGLLAGRVFASWELVIGSARPQDVGTSLRGHDACTPFQESLCCPQKVYFLSE
jgi:hypothetical protein